MTATAILSSITTSFDPAKAEAFAGTLLAMLNALTVDQIVDDDPAQQTYHLPAERERAIKMPKWRKLSAI